MPKCDRCGKDEPDLFIDEDSHEQQCENCYRGDNDGT